MNLKNSKIRLQKYLALCGVCARRKAEELIIAGRVKVNGVVKSELGVKVIQGKDMVMVDDQLVSQEDKVYYILNKPSGYTCSLSDKHAEKFVVDLIDTDLRIFPVGRLDKETEGLLILTNDGDFANNIIHPAKKIAKEYEVHLNRKLTQSDVNKLKMGWEMDGVKVFFDEIKRISQNIYNIVIFQGRKRQIRRMFEKLGINVVYLRRVRIGKLLVLGLKVGEFRQLSEKEIDLFKQK